MCARAKGNYLDCHGWLIRLVEESLDLAPHRLLSADQPADGRLVHDEKHQRRLRLLQELLSLDAHLHGEIHDSSEAWGSRFRIMVAAYSPVCSRPGISIGWKFLMMKEADSYSMSWIRRGDESR